MSDLISRAALLKALRKEKRECEKDGEEYGGESILFAEAFGDVIDMVKRLPAVDAVPAEEQEQIILDKEAEIERLEALIAEQDVIITRLPYLMLAHGVKMKPQKPMELPNAVYALHDVLLETRGNDDMLWCRCVYQDDGTVAICTTVGKLYYRQSDYGRKWRCWQERPTEAERKATGWEG